MIKEYKIDTEIYSDSIVFQAIEDFKDVSDIKYNNSIIFIGDNDGDTIFNELMNYIVGLINE